jgi:hypothetical protein
VINLQKAIALAHQRGNRLVDCDCGAHWASLVPLPRQERSCPLPIPGLCNQRCNGSEAIGWIGHWTGPLILMLNAHTAARRSAGSKSFERRTTDRARDDMLVDAAT